MVRLTFQLKSNGKLHLRTTSSSPQLHLRLLSSLYLLSRRVELLEIGDNIVDLLRILEARERHFGAAYLGHRILDVFAEGCFIPSDAGILVCSRVAVTCNRPGLA